MVSVVLYMEEDLKPLLSNMHSHTSLFQKIEDQKFWLQNNELLQLQKHLEKDNTKTKEEALLEIYKRLRPGEPPTVDSAVSLIDSLFFDAKRYDLYDVYSWKLCNKRRTCL